MAKINEDYFIGYGEGYGEGYDKGKMEAGVNIPKGQLDKESLQKIEEKLRRLYVRGVYDGMDMVRGNNDRFMGNASARAEWEDGLIVKAYLDIMDLLKV